MKRIIIAFIFLALSQSAFSEIRPEYSGSWFNPDQSGHGFSVEVLSSGRTIVYWYTYDPFGNSIFLFGDATNVGNRIQAQVYFLQGMVFGEFDPDTNELFDWGTLTITFHDCTHATLEYDSILQYQSGEVFGSGEMPLVRLASMDSFKCSDYPISGIYNGYSIENNIFIGNVGIISETGEINLLSSDGVLIFGQLQASAGMFGQLTANTTALAFDEFGSTVANINGNGTFGPDGILLDYFNPLSGVSGQIILSKSNYLTTRSVSLSDLQGNWTGLNVLIQLNVPMSISASGTISATDSTGCDYNGQVTIPNPERNILTVSVSITGCINAGTFNGNGFYNPRGDVITFWGWNGFDNAGVFTLTRN